MKTGLLLLSWIAVGSLGLMGCTTEIVGTGRPPPPPTGEVTNTGGETTADSDLTSDDDAKSSSPSSGTQRPSFTITVNGVRGTPLKVETQEDVVESGLRRSAVLYFTGRGFGEGTRIVVGMVAPGSGCELGAQLEYHPADGTGDVYISPSDSSCGLVSKTVNANRLAGSFHGELVTDFGPEPWRATVELTFDIPTTK